MKLLSFTDSVTDCDCCGRSDLKGTYLLTDEFNNEFYFGSSCAKKRGVTAKELRSSLTKYESTLKTVNIYLFRQKLEVSKEVKDQMIKHAGSGKSLFNFNK